MAAQQRVYELHAAIKHGDDEHQRWLLDALLAWSEGCPVPPPRGSGNKEARIASLESELTQLRAAVEGLRPLVERVRAADSVTAVARHAADCPERRAAYLSATSAIRDLADACLALFPEE